MKLKINMKFIEYNEFSFAHLKCVLRAANVHRQSALELK